MLVSEMQRVSDLAGDPDRVGNREAIRVGLEEFGYGAAADQLRNDPGRVILLDHVVNRDDVWVLVQLRGGRISCSTRADMPRLVARLLTRASATSRPRRMSGARNTSLLAPVPSDRLSS